MNSKLNLPFEYYFLPDDGPSFLKAGNVLTNVDMYGVFMCTQGSIEVSTGHGRHVVKRHCIYFYTPSAFTHIVAVTADFRGVVIRVDSEFVMPLIAHLLDMRSQLYILNHPLVEITPRQSADIGKMMMTMHDRMEQENACGDIDPNRRAVLTELIKSMAQTLCYEVLNICLQNQPMEVEAPDRNDAVLQRFLVSLGYNFRRQRSVAFYAGEQCLSYSYFSDIVKRKTGRTALRWIVEAVVTEARQMLEFTDCSVKEIAARLNFPTQTFFGKYFKQYVGLSPKEYRSQARRKNALAPEHQLDVKLVEGPH